MYGTCGSTGGIGVEGYVHSSTGSTYGVFGQSNSISGTGVCGLAIATTGTSQGNPVGVVGITENTNFVGSDAIAGVFGLANNGYGVYGISTGGTAVYGSSAGPNVGAVTGANVSITGTNAGVSGSTVQTMGTVSMGSLRMLLTEKEEWGYLDRLVMTAPYPSLLEVIPQLRVGTCRNGRTVEGLR